MGTGADILSAARRFDLFSLAGEDLRALTKQDALGIKGLHKTIASSASRASVVGGALQRSEIFQTRALYADMASQIHDVAASAGVRNQLVASVTEAARALYTPELHATVIGDLRAAAVSSSVVNDLVGLSRESLAALAASASAELESIITAADDPPEDEGDATNDSVMARLLGLPRMELIGIVCLCLSAVNGMTWSYEDATGAEIPDAVQHAVSALLAVAALVLRVLDTREDD